MSGESAKVALGEQLLPIDTYRAQVCVKYGGVTGFMNDTGNMNDTGVTGDTSVAASDGNLAKNKAADVEMSQYVADRARVNEEKIRQDEQIVAEFGDYNYGWHDSDAAGEAAKKGIDESVVRAISADKNEPEWMLNLRLQGYRAFLQKPMPDWGVDLSGFDADDFKYYVRPVHDLSLIHI